MTRAPFTPDEIRAAEIEAARGEGRRAGLMEAMEVARNRREQLAPVGQKISARMANRAYEAELITRALEAKAMVGR